jgi:hypothetical protein
MATHPSIRNPLTRRRMLSLVQRRPGPKAGWAGSAARQANHESLEKLAVRAEAAALDHRKAVLDHQKAVLDHQKASIAQVTHCSWWDAREKGELCSKHRGRVVIYDIDLVDLGVSNVEEIAFDQREPAEEERTTGAPGRVPPSDLPRRYTSDELFASRGYTWMRFGVALTGVLLGVAVVLGTFVDRRLGLAVLWLAGAVFCFCNYATARLGYPQYLIGPAVAAYGVLACLMLAATAVTAAVFD